MVFSGTCGLLCPTCACFFGVRPHLALRRSMQFCPSPFLRCQGDTVVDGLGISLVQLGVGVTSFSGRLLSLSGSGTSLLVLIVQYLPRLLACMSLHSRAAVVPGVRKNVKNY
eukprot:4224028-Amphidinium_carterae.1